MTDYLPIILGICIFFRRKIFHQVKKFSVGTKKLVIFKEIFSCDLTDGGGVMYKNHTFPTIYLYITTKEYIFREEKSYKELGRVNIDSIEKIYDQTVEEHLKRLGGLGKKMIEDRKRMAKSSEFIPNTLSHTVLKFDDKSGKTIANITFYCRKDLTDFYSKIIL